ncbi:hypothetical protein OSB04_016250 [Centaurea solstitialis]|uniref:Protein kinase domain-containing protein n=1 Tax=Centaurea solstitialis TaxID=347529 RepID=A0AA38TCG6_9ASTR|nr:hypothetical protein OSB04_016250 [Centaurea solstitialis]
MLPEISMEVEPSFLVSDQICQCFSHDQIVSATQNFDEALILGQGGFGKVYKGMIKDYSNTFVAIKRSNSMSNQGALQFRAEVEMLSRIRHCNLVSLIGYCNEGTEMALVYEYMPEGTLADHLHKPGVALSWLQLLKICIGAARGLDYLHTGTGTQHGIIHRDVKSSNILLDNNFAAKISDFGLAKIGPTNQTRTHVNTLVKGTFGYLDPHYVYTGELTRKTDVYSFGVLLLEVICGRPAVDRSLDEDQWGLAPWAQERIKQGKRNHIIDSRLRGQISSSCLKGFVRIASQCLHNQPNQRPRMTEIVGRLEIVLSLQEREGSSIAERGFMSKFWSFFQAKVESTASEGESSNKEGAQVNDALVTRGKAKVDLGHNDLSPLIQTSGREGDFSDKTGILKSFSYNVLKEATRNFRRDRLPGESSFGTVFKGWIDGTAIAVRRIKQRHHDSDYNWLAEISDLSKLNHPNLVKLIGYCIEEDYIFLIYDFMYEDSLEYHLFERDGNVDHLSWKQRIKVALGAAKGLAYLHNQEAKMIYSNIKPNSIFVDSDHNGKLSNFGLTEDVQGSGRDTFGTIEFAYFRYAAPEYIATGQVTPRSKTYSFGLVLLSKKIVDHNRPANERMLVDFARPYLTRNQGILQIIDPCIEGQCSSIVAMRFAMILNRCLSKIPGDRPTADEVVKALEELIDLQESAPTSTRKAVWKPPVIPATWSTSPARFFPARLFPSKPYLFRQPSARSHLFPAKLLARTTTFISDTHHLLRQRQSPPPTIFSGNVNFRHPPSSPATFINPSANSPAYSNPKTVVHCPKSSASLPEKMVVVGKSPEKMVVAGKS